ncbi:NAD(P)-dependent oxidoreductase [Actinocorallia populi]|uniref:NAD(P)-dependent oxidoreductase n=1 Tax=Actinocorallia populi TaxID=2079200 RepID=UPI0013001BAC|nr:NAD(P)-binding domain-containing protein [Actinocorallia populi]
MTVENTRDVAVLGLGEMGAAIAGALLAAGHRTTVWNRTPEKAEEAVAGGARRAATVPDAVAAGEVVFISVKGAAAVRKILEEAGGALAGRTVVNLTDGTSAEARETARLAAGSGAEYLHGQIMTIVPGIGHPEAVVFFGGEQAVYDRHRPLLDLLGGKGTLVAADPGVPVLYGMSVHGIMWGLLNGFLHAAALLTDEGVELKRFLDQAAPSLAALMSFLPSIADEVEHSRHAAEYGALRHHHPSVDDLLRESRDRGVDDRLPAHTLSLVARALADGHADDSYSRLVDAFRTP